MAHDTRTRTAHPPHIVHFYDADQDLVEAVGAYLVAGVYGGATPVLIATPDHTAAFLGTLAEAGLDVGAALDEGRIVTLDAREVLEKILVDGRPDATAFDGVVGELVRGIERKGRRAFGYGEMVALLWEAGDVAGAIELEELWNALLGRTDFSLYCAYPSTIVADDEDAEKLAYVCSLHSEVKTFGRAQDAERTAAEREHTRHFECTPEGPAAARHFLTSTFDLWGLDTTLVDEGALVVTELATNAVIHARSAFAVTLESRGTGVRISVHDHGASDAKLEPSGVTATSGRGLLLVRALARRWGTSRTDGGKVIWAELDATAAGASS